MDVLIASKRFAVLYLGCTLLCTVSGCKQKSRHDAIAELRPVVQRFSTTEEAAAFLKNCPLMELFPHEAAMDSDVGGVTFEWGTRLTLEHAVALEKFEKLAFITAHYCNIDAGFFDRLSNSDVRLLGLGNSNLDDSSIAAITSLPKIRAVNVYNTKVTKEGVEKLRSTLGFENVVTYPD